MFANFELSDPQVNAKGGRFCSLSDDKKAAILFPQGKLFAPFGGPSTYDSGPYTPRQTLELRCDDELAAIMREFDTWAISYLEANAERLFKKKISKKALMENYRSPMHQKGDYQPNLRCKIDMEGRGVCRYWTPNAVETIAPDDYKAHDLRVRIHIRSMWFMQAQFGFTLQITDIQLFPKTPVCPFKMTEIESSPFSKEESCCMEEDGDASEETTR